MVIIRKIFWLKPFWLKFAAQALSSSDEAVLRGSARLCYEALCCSGPCYEAVLRRVAL